VDIEVINDLGKPTSDLVTAGDAELIKEVERLGFAVGWVGVACPARR
jgi:hypothetical protein